MSLTVWDDNKPHWKHLEEPGVVGRKRRRKGRKDALQAAYDDVDARDGGICWVTGRTTRSGNVDASVRREHHHLKGRRVRPDWVTQPERIITTCAEVHELITRGWIVVEGADARKPIRFHWAAHVQPEMRTIRIRSRRLSQDSE